MQTTTSQAKRAARCSEPDDRAFFYVDGVPTKGIWLDLESVDSWADIHEALHRAGVVGAEYGGDIQVADVEGAIATACYSSQFDTIDLTAYLDLRSDIDQHGFNAGAVVTFINWYGSWDADAFENAYMGTHDSELAFADQYIDDVGVLSDMPAHLQCYFDYDAFSRDLFCGDYWFDDGFVFSCNC
jgi:antirestriction protein